MKRTIASVRGACTIGVAIAALGSARAETLITTPLCPLVAPPRDTVAELIGAPSTSGRPLGTDLGFSYTANGTTTLLFGDTWPDSSYSTVCPARQADDALATLSVAPDWAGFTSSGPLTDEQCPQLDWVLNPRGTEPAPILLHRWDGQRIFMGPLNTPVAAFHDGEREWGVFITAGGLSCPLLDSLQAKPCPTDPDPLASQLTCGLGLQPSCFDPATCGLGAGPLCVDPSSAQGSEEGRRAFVLHIAERIGPHWYRSRYAFVTNKFLSMTVRTVASFDPAGTRDYTPGSGALLVWGRPGFDAKGGGEAPPHFLYHPLPFERSGEKIVFTPRYFRGTEGGTALFTANQTEARPLYGDEFDPVVHMAVSYVAPLQRWLMLYGGDLPTALNPDGNDPNHPQPVPRAVHARFADDPWGPWTNPIAALAREQVAGHLVCAPDGNPAGCRPRPVPPIRPLCLEALDVEGGGRLYGVNILDALTREVSAPAGQRAADVFWNVSTWHPYGVLLIRSRLQSDVTP